jgi:chitinase
LLLGIAGVLGGGCGQVTSPPDAGAVAPPAGATVFSPYFFDWAWSDPAYSFSSLVDMQAKGGASAPSSVTLAFVLSDGSCRATAEIQAQRTDLAAYAAAGGHLKASFGGALGDYLEYECTTPAAFAQALGAFVDATGITDLDFDLEQHSMSSNPALNQLRAAGLRQLQDQRHVAVSFTLPAAPSGLLKESVDILQAAIDAGVDISVINGMTMDYGDGTDLSTTPVRSVDGIARQVLALYPSLSLDEAYQRIGATAMIGKNDDDETFTLDDARALISHAQQHQLGLVSFWAIQRDQPCGSSHDVNVCSQLDTAPFQFSAIFASVHTP